MRRTQFFTACIVTFILFATFCFSQDADNLVTRYSYDPVGNLAWVHLANGNFTHYTYDALNRLTEQVTYQTRPTAENPNPPELSRYSYLYYVNGRRAQSVETQNGVTSTYQWKYDNLGRMKEEVLVGVYTHQWTYDLVGNKRTYTATQEGGSPIVTTYTYNECDQLLTETSPAGTITYTYDANGSLISKQSPGGTETYEYNLQNKLKKYTSATGEQTTYQYDPSGNLIQKTTGASVTEYLIDPYNPTGYSQVLTKTTGSDKTTYTHGLDVISQSVNDEDPQYFLYDGHGSVRQLTDQSGAQIPNQSYWYDAWGNLFAGILPNTSLLYSGEEYDTETGLYYLRARMYDPLTGRFTSTDPFSGNHTDPQSLHKYLYCHADPINGIDPTGQFTKMEVMTVIGIISFFGFTQPAIHQNIKKETDEMISDWGKSAITCLDKGVQSQREDNLDKIDNPDFLDLTETMYHDHGQYHKQVTYYNHRMNLTALQGIDATIHTAQLAGAALGTISSVNGVNGPIKIYWPNKIPHPKDGWEHWWTLEENAIWNAMERDDIVAIYVNKKLSTSAGYYVGKNYQPDLFLLTKRNTFIIHEVRSPSQTQLELLEKGWKYKQMFQGRLESYNAWEIGQKIQ